MRNYGHRVTKEEKVVCDLELNLTKNKGLKSDSNLKKKTMEKWMCKVDIHLE